jgi:hypothetical protein
VVNENADWTLHRKQMCRVVHRTAQPIPSRARRRIGLAQAATAARVLMRVNS